MTSSKSTTAETDPLQDAIKCIRQVCSSISEVIAGIPNFSFHRPNDLSIELGLDPKLAWTLGRCVENSDPFVAAQFIPGPTGMKKFFQLASKRHVNGALIDAAELAFRNFESVVRSHAGTRKEFNALATGISSKVRPSSDIDHRRRAFEGISYIWGVRARTLFRTYLVLPSADELMWDLVALRGIVDFSRLRPNIAWRMSRPVSVDNSRTFHHEVVREPLDPNIPTNTSELPLLLDVCTKPIPRFREVKSWTGEHEFEFVSNSVGRNHQITCVTGEILRRVEPRYGNEVYDDMCFSFPVRTPASSLIFDILIHRDLFSNSEPLKPNLFSDLFGGGPGFYYEESDRLPLHESMQYLGEGNSVSTPDIPNYAEMLGLAFSRSGFPAEEFNAYRLRIEYPPLSTTLLIGRKLPKGPDPRLARS